MGGLGLVPLKSRNLVMLAKWVWRCYSERSAWWNKVLSSKYGPSLNYDLGRLEIKKDSSYPIQSILRLGSNYELNALVNRSNFKWIPGNGELINFWEDFWISDRPIMHQLPRLYRITNFKHSSVKDFLTKWVEGSVSSSDLWIRPLLSREEEDLNSLNRILSTISLSNLKDKLFWSPGKGAFTSKICTSLLQQNHTSNRNQIEVWNSIWSAKVPPKIRIFLWKLESNSIPTLLLLSQRIQNFNLGSMCPWCRAAEESVKHLFWDCSIAKWAWDYVRTWWSVLNKLVSTSEFSLVKLFKMQRNKQCRKIWIMVIAAACWTIWLARNDFIFNKSKITKETLEFLIFTRVNKWGAASHIINFSKDALWKVNPQGSIAIHLHSLSDSFWTYKYTQFEVVCAVDGAGIYDHVGHLRGGIGGNLKINKGSLRYVFSGPCYVSSSSEAELLAILHVTGLWMDGLISPKKMIICSDSREAINLCKTGYLNGFPILVRNRNIKSIIGDFIQIEYVPSDLNYEADSLATNGINRQSLQSVWV